MAERILGRDEIAEMEKLTVDRVVEAIDDAIKATSIQGKPNFVDLLRQPYERMDMVIAKAARRQSGEED